MAPAPADPAAIIDEFEAVTVPDDGGTISVPVAFGITRARVQARGFEFVRMSAFVKILRASGFVVQSAPDGERYVFDRRQIASPRTTPTPPRPVPGSRRPGQLNAEIRSAMADGTRKSEGRRN